MTFRPFAVALALCLLLIRSAHAEDRGLAVLVGSSEGDPIVLKISDELRALGFEVEVAQHGSDRARIRNRAKPNDAVAVVLIDEREIEVRIVTPEQVQERRLARRGTDASTSALAAVEVIRGYLVPVEQSPRDVPGTSPPIPATPAASPQPKLPSITARLGAGFMSAGSYPTLASVTLGGAKHFGRFAVDVSAVATMPRADAWSGGLDVDAQFAPLGFTRPVSFALGIGAGGLAVAYKEDAKKYSTDLLLVPHVGLVARAAITQSFFARVDAKFGVAVPSPEFKTKTGSDIQFGSTTQSVTVAVEVAW